MDKFIVLFQGQGSINSDMVTRLSKNGLGKEYLKYVRNIMDADLLNISYEEIQESIAYSSVITCLYGIVCYKEYMKGHSLKPTLLLGHSLGEYTALAVAEAISIPDTIKILNRRGILADGVKEKTKGGMLVVNNVEEKGFFKLIQNYNEKHHTDIYIACVNGERQFCVCAVKEVLESFSNYLKRFNIKVKLLKNIPPFHTKMMLSAQKELLEILKSVPVTVPIIPVLSCISGKLYTTEEKLYIQLCDHLVRTVEWNKAVSFCDKIGAYKYIEMGDKAILGNFTYNLKGIEFSTYVFPTETI